MMRIIKKSLPTNLYIWIFLTEITYLAFYLTGFLKKTVGDNSLVVSNNLIYFFITSLMLVLFYLYTTGHKIFLNDKIKFKHVFMASLVFNITLFFVWPLTSNDIFSYIYQTRVITTHHLNPFVVPFSTLTSDILFSVISNKWSVDTAIYGPAFFFITAPFVKIAQDNLILIVYLLKLLFVLVNLVNVVLVYKISNNKIAAYLYAICPTFVFEFAGNGHHETIIIFFVLLSLLFLIKERKIKWYLMSIVFLVVAALIKFYIIILLPLYALFILRQLKNKQSSMIFMLLAGLISILEVMIFYLPFWEGFVVFSRYPNVLNLSNLLASPLVLLNYVLLKQFGVDEFLYWGRVLARYSFILIYFIYGVRLLLKNKLNNTEELLYSISVVIIMLFTTSFNWLMPWYTTLLTTLVFIYMGYTNNFKWLTKTYALIFVTILVYIILR
ncbi:glycosyltransferase family 39 protein [Candidatus Woesebacteria bacterium]|nr:MAG: glycosyltransferase family 39 protein [Candidatus Woesebacteria bacterium]